jgi:hypothetical protein
MNDKNLLAPSALFRFAKISSHHSYHSYHSIIYIIFLAARPQRSGKILKHVQYRLKGWEFMRVRIFFLLLPFCLFCVAPPAGREPFFPFVSGDGFRFLADHVYDELDQAIDPSKIEARAILFVKGALLGDFFQKIHPRIPNPYLLISHNSDESVPGPYASFLDEEKIIVWFGVNYDGYPHPKMHPIPIGLANRCWPYGEIAALEKTRGETHPKIHLAMMNFSIETFSPERWGVFKLFAHAPFCYRTGKKAFGHYLPDAAASKFVISPRGFGLDTYRLWECLYLGTIPVVKTSSLDVLYEGLPVLIIPDWEAVTQMFLEEKYREMSQKMFSLEKLEMDYWIRLIEALKNA